MAQTTSSSSAVDVGQSWRDRWESFCLVTPNWSVQLPGRRLRRGRSGRLHAHGTRSSRFLERYAPVDPGSRFAKALRCGSLESVPVGKALPPETRVGETPSAAGWSSPPAPTSAPIDRQAPKSLRAGRSPGSTSAITTRSGCPPARSSPRRRQRPVWLPAGGGVARGGSRSRARVRQGARGRRGSVGGRDITGGLVESGFLDHTVAMMPSPYVRPWSERPRHRPRKRRTTWTSARFARSGSRWVGHFLGADAAGARFALGPRGNGGLG